MESHFGGKPEVRRVMREWLSGASADRLGEAARRLVDAPLFARAKRVAVSAHRPRVAALLRRRGVEVVEGIEGVDVIVAHAVAATRGGKRCGFGTGGTDLGFALAQLHGQRAVEVVTTLLPEQLVEFFPTYEHDVELSWIATPDELIEVPGPVFAPREIVWDRLEASHYEAFPQLRTMSERPSW